MNLDERLTTYKDIRHNSQTFLLEYVGQNIKRKNKQTN